MLLTGPVTPSLAHPVSSDATSVDLIIPNQACGEHPENLLVDPTVVYNSDSITIAVRAGVYDQPPGCLLLVTEIPLTVQLTEPVGNRQLLGGDLR